MCPIAWNASWWYVYFWIHLVCYLPLISLLTSLPFQGPFPPFEGWLFLVILRGLFFTRIVFYDVYYFKNHPPKEFQVHTFPFDWVFGVAALQLPLGFHPIFSYTKSHDWNEAKGYLSFYVSITYLSIFISIRCGNPKLLARQVGYRIWALMVVRENVLELILKF